MKKSGTILILLLVMTLITTAFIIPDRAPPNDPPEDIPDSVWAIFEISCYDCHSNNGQGLAKAKLNFDKWDVYSVEKQVKKRKTSAKSCRVRRCLLQNTSRKIRMLLPPQLKLYVYVTGWVN